METRRFFRHLFSGFFIRNLLLLLGISLLAGHFIVSHDRNWHTLLRNPYYYSSVLMSACIALALLLWVYAVSFKLNRRFSGMGLDRRWMMLQLRYGVLGTIVVELALATLLFHLQGYWILDTAFFKKLFLPVVLFVLLANLCYMLYYMHRDPLVRLSVKYQLMRGRPLIVDTTEVSMPALFYVSDGDVWRVDFDGSREIISEPISYWEQKLPAVDYFRSSRTWMIHRGAIAKVAAVHGKRLSVTCTVAGQEVTELIVSRRNTPAFKVWFSGQTAQG